MQSILPILQIIAQGCGLFSTIVMAVLLVYRPARERFFGLSQYLNGQKCLLRSQMLATYYKSKEKGCIRQYEFENFVLLYAAYKALHGNSFVDKINEEVREMEIVS